VYDLDVVDLDAALGQQFFHVTVREVEPQIPAHREDDHLGPKPKPSERRRRR
jgi:hypothetical protein